MLRISHFKHTRGLTRSLAVILCGLDLFSPEQAYTHTGTHVRTTIHRNTHTNTHVHPCIKTLFISHTQKHALFIPHTHTFT
jgi:hypothetical protein